MKKPDYEAIRKHINQEFGNSYTLKAIDPGILTVVLNRVEKLEKVLEASKELFKLLEFDIGMDKTELTMLRAALADIGEKPEREEFEE